MPESAKQKTPSEVLINGGKKHTVSKKDGSTEEVLVLLLPLTKVGPYFTLSDDIFKFVELLLDKPAGYGATLDEDSLFEIDVIGKELNSFRMGRYLQRQVATQEHIRPFLPSSIASRISAPTE